MHFTLQATNAQDFFKLKKEANSSICNLIKNQTAHQPQDTFTLTSHVGERDRNVLENRSVDYRYE